MRRDGTSHTVCMYIDCRPSFLGIPYIIGSIFREAGDGSLLTYHYVRGCFVHTLSPHMSCPGELRMHTPR